MRIVSGEFGGRTLVAPKGIMTRPTTDRVREALMSAIGSIRGGFAGAVVLDAFAGSGALGLEALSRGSDQVVFFEKQHTALKALKTNIESLGLGPDQVTVHSADVLKHGSCKPSRPFDIVFLDPPYNMAPSTVARLLDGLGSEGLIATDALVSYEHAKASDAAVLEAFGPLPWEGVSHKRYGDVSIDILKYRKP